MKILKIEFFLAVISLALLFTSCTWNVEENPVPSTETTVWSGPKITFEKTNGADPTLAENQDRITDLVWLTRGNDGGQLFNAASEANSTKATSPSGTRWAKGTTESIDNLIFDSFRAAIGQPKNAIGQDLVLLLVEENIAIDIKLTKWVGNQQGGFAYERSSP
ncbi:MAG: hypothetical protein AAF927_02155 [Bacteroidota bacterium]